MTTVHLSWGRLVAASLPFVLLAFLLPAPAVATETDRVAGARFTSPELVRGIPPGWVLDRKTGTVNLRLAQEGESFVLGLTSDRHSSFGIKRGLRVDLRQYPFLNWRWKAVRLPQGGDVRCADTDDQVLQFYVALPPMGFPASLNTPVLGYIWDNEAPRGWTGRSDQIGGGKLRYVVMRNKADRLGEWYVEKRNVFQDLKRLFGDLKRIDFVTHGIEFYTNGQNTKSEAEGWIGDVFFSRN
jgi:hypothetical protein